MATRFIQEATKSLAPVYDQQEKAISSQLPAIQNLYNSLITGLQGQYNSQLQTGTQNIVEDASARGVLRSTLPVDARQSLTTELGRALMEGQAQYGRQQASDVAGINEKLGGLRIQRTGAIADLARSLETKDLERQQFEYQKQLDAQKLALQRQELAASRARSSGGGGSSNVRQQMVEALASRTGSDGYVSPGTWNTLRNQWVAGGYGNASTFDTAFAGFRNPRNPYYAVTSRSYADNKAIKNLR